MNWEDECYLLSKRKFRENANIINVFTPNKGKVGGIVYGGNSRKIRNFLQIGNKLFVFNNSKNDNKIGDTIGDHFKIIQKFVFWKMGCSILCPVLGTVEDSINIQKYMRTVLASI